MEASTGRGDQHGNEMQIELARGIVLAPTIMNNRSKWNIAWTCDETNKLLFLLQVAHPHLVPKRTMPCSKTWFVHMGAYRTLRVIF